MLGYLDVVSVPIFPTKADTILIVDPYAVLAFPIACQFLQPVTGNGDVSQVAGLIQHLQLTSCWSDRPALATLTGVPKLCRSFIGKGLYHTSHLNVLR